MGGRPCHVGEQTVQPLLEFQDQQGIFDLAFEFSRANSQREGTGSEREEGEPRYQSIVTRD